MRTLLLAALLLASALASAAPSAAAQQQGALTIHLDPAPASLGPGGSVVIQGFAKLVTDATVYASSPNGVPIHFTVDGTPWMSAVVNPPMDIFPLPALPSGGAVMSHLPFTITITAAELDEDRYGIVNLRGSTQAGFLGQSFSGLGSTQVFYDAPDEEEECHALTPEQKAELMRLGADAYNAYHQEHAAPEEESDEVSVQATGATPLAPASWALAAFGLAGAALGFVARRRLAK